ncbi:phage integrase N-terminal SAM-like domain-containing protein [Vibrio fluvialis]|nr:phage integrase N-terminal SAM-like domain-containing protein [Vibrio fluvialis]
MSLKSPFLKGLQEEMRMRGYSIRTEKTYLYWIKAFINFHHKRHPETMGTEEVAQFSTFLANKRNVAINTQKIALNALAYLYQKHLHHELGDLGFCYATKQRHLPTVLSQLEISLISNELHGRDRLIIERLYGSGLRVSECLRLRVQDIDIVGASLTVRGGKGHKDRQTILSHKCAEKLTTYIERLLKFNRMTTDKGLVHLCQMH